MPRLDKRLTSSPPLIRRLYFQLVAFGGIAVAAAILLFTWKVGNDQLDSALQSSRIQAQTLVSNTASVAGNYLVVKDFSALEELLLQAARFPDVISFSITDDKGIVFASVKKNKQGQAEADFSLLKIELPKQNIETVTTVNNKIEILHPVEQGTLGWVRLVFSLEQAAVIERRTWRNGIITALVAFVLSILLLVLLLKRPMRAISHATEFARSLYKHTGKVMPFEKSAFEIEQLEHALNYASHQIYASNKDLTDIKLALDAHAIVGITNSDGYLTYVNDKFCQLSGFRRKELLGKQYSLLKSNFHDETFYRDLWKTITNGKIWHGEIKDKTKEGTEYWVDTTIVPFLDKQGKPYQYVGIQTDITECKKVTSELKDYQEHLEEKVAERTHKLQLANSELESFCYSVSHDLKAPLRSITGFSEALLEDYADTLDQQARNYLNRVCASSQRMGQLINDLLQLSKVVRADMSRSPVNLSVLAAQVVEHLSASEPQREVKFICMDACIVSGDERLLLTMLENVIGNAWKFTAHTDHAQIEFGVEQHEEDSVYFVRDNGAGFDDKYKHKMFEPFQRLHSDKIYQGSGIGLATVQRIIRRHGGEVWAESALEQGAVIYFTLGD